MIICSTSETCKSTLLEVGKDAVTGHVACGWGGSWSCYNEFIRHRVCVKGKKVTLCNVQWQVHICIGFWTFVLPLWWRNRFWLDRYLRRRTRWMNYFSTVGTTRFHSILDICYQMASMCLQWILDFCLTIVIEKLILTWRIFAKHDSWDEHFSSRPYAFPFNCGHLFYHNCDGGTNFDCRDICEASCVGWLTSTSILGGDATRWLFMEVEASPCMPCCAQAIGIVPERINVLLEGVSLITWIVL